MRALSLLFLSVFLTAPAPAAEPTVQLIRAVPRGGTDLWDARVATALVAEFDADRSGQLDTRGEIHAIPCSVWTAVDQGARVSWPAGLYVTYGFAPAARWGGYSLGFAASARAWAADAIRECGLVEAGLGSEGPDVEAILDQLQQVPDGGTAAWTDRSRAVLVTGFDRDGDGVLAADWEIESIPCDVWSVLDEGVRKGWSTGIYGVYGFQPGGRFEGQELGISPDARARAGVKLHACGLAEDGPVRPDGEALSLAILAVPDGGGGRWDRSVRGLVLTAFDLDRSGALDHADEVELVPCSVWQALDTGVREGWGGGMFEMYGFVQGAPFVGEVLGIDGSMRNTAGDALGSCNLAGASSLEDPAAGTPSARLLAIEVGAGDWADRARPVVLAAFDRDQSGSIDTAEEVDAIECDSWGAMEHAVRTQWVTSGVSVIYGFGGGYLWVGDLLGFDASQRAAAGGALEACGFGSNAPPLPSSPETLLIRLLTVPDPGSASWDGVVRPWLLDVFDEDRTGSLDSRKEIKSVPCEIWAALDESVRPAWGAGLHEVYGFGGNVPWMGVVLGIDEASREDASRAISACVKPTATRAGVGSTPAWRIRALVEPGSAAWDAGVRGVLLGAFELDGTGRIDAQEEVRAVGCDVWQALDDAARGGWDDSLAHAYGFTRGTAWLAHMLGFEEIVRADALRAMRRCHAVSRD